MFRLKHIKHAIKILSTFPTKITSVDQLNGIKGIGKGILARINELLQTGKLGEITITHDSDKYLAYVSELEQIYGIGRAKALELITVHNIKSIQELKDAIKNNKIVLSDNIMTGLKYYGVYQQHIPRSEVLEYDIILHKFLQEIDPNLIGIVCGSYRRLSLVSNDIDFLFVHPNIITKNDTYINNLLTVFVNKLLNNKIIVDVLTGSDTPTKFMGFCSLPHNNSIIRRIDIRFMPFESYYTALLYFTGSGEFNRKMRHVAIGMNYKLNEYGLYKLKKNDKLVKMKVTSEKDVFDYLGLEYLDPQFRK